MCCMLKANHRKKNQQQINTKILDVTLNFAKTHFNILLLSIIIIKTLQPNKKQQNIQRHGTNNLKIVGMF